MVCIEKFDRETEILTFTGSFFRESISFVRHLLYSFLLVIFILFQCLRHSNKCSKLRWCVSLVSGRTVICNFCDTYLLYRSEFFQQSKKGTWRYQYIRRKSFDWWSRASKSMHPIHTSIKKYGLIVGCILRLSAFIVRDKKKTKTHMKFGLIQPIYT